MDAYGQSYRSMQDAKRHDDMTKNKPKLTKQALSALNTSPQKKAAEQKKQLIDIAKKQKRRKIK